MNINGKGRYAFFILFSIAAMLLVTMLLPAWFSQWFWIWMLNMALMFVIAGVIGLSIKGSTGFWAIFVDYRRMVSLSRFQIVLWTIVILSAFWTVAIGRVGDSIRNPAGYQCTSQNATTCSAPLALTLPPILWALMGISITSSVASPLIKEEKDRRKTAAADTAIALRNADTNDAIKTAAANKADGERLFRKGPDLNPEFADMFHGESNETKNFVDIAKVQNFFFTLVALAAYVAAIGAALSQVHSIALFFQFPPIDQSLVTILGISHAGYLTSKAVTN